jgi:hypothetical protein
MAGYSSAMSSSPGSQNGGTNLVFSMLYPSDGLALDIEDFLDAALDRGLEDEDLEYMDEPVPPSASRPPTPMRASPMASVATPRLQLRYQHAPIMGQRHPHLHFRERGRYRYYFVDSMLTGIGGLHESWSVTLLILNRFALNVSRDSVDQALQDGSIALSKIRGLSAFNQAQWMQAQWFRALRMGGTFSVPPRSEWPVPDFTSRPLSNLPLPFIVGESRMLYEYPNPLQGENNGVLGAGLHLPDEARAHPNVTVRSARLAARGGGATAPPAYTRQAARSAASGSSNAPGPSTRTLRSSALASLSSASASSSSPEYWVVVRGVIPGLYDNQNQLRHAVCRCQGSAVRRFQNVGEAAAYYARIQSTGKGQVLECRCGL